MPDINNGKVASIKSWFAVAGILLIGIVALLFYGPVIQQPAPENVPVVNPSPESLSGRWVDTNFAEVVIELSATGEFTLANRGVPFLSRGVYECSKGQLKLELSDTFSDVRNFQMKILSLDRTEMTVSYRKITTLGKEAQTTLWRINPDDYSPLRSKLIGRWALTEDPGGILEFMADDSFKRGFHGKADRGIFRVFDDTLEYHVGDHQSPVVRFQIKSDVESVLVLFSEIQQKEFRYSKLGS